MSEYMIVDSKNCNQNFCSNSDYFRISNLFNELKTEIDKANARYNLGIDDNLQLKWGNITGYIENQKDLTEYINNFIIIYKSKIQEDFEYLKKQLENKIQNEVNLIEEDRLRIEGLIQRFIDFENEMRKIVPYKIRYDHGTSIHSVGDALDELLYNNNNIQGGFYTVNNIQERDEIPITKRKVGMLCYVIEDDKYYKLEDDGSWGKANLSGSGIIQIESLDDIENLDNIEPGQMVYIKDLDEFRYAKDLENWGILNNIVVSETEPSTEALWIDPTGDSDLNQEGNLTSIRKSILTLQQQMERVIKILEYGAIAGDSSIGARTQLMSSAEPINPNDDDTQDSDEPEDTETRQIEPDHLLYTIPNLSIKVDTLVNFSTNYRNLINGELIWISDKNSLYIYVDGKFIPISNGSSPDIPTTGDDMTKEDIEKLYFNHLGFINTKEEQYKMEVNENGNIIVYNTANYDGNIGNKGKYGSYISDYLRINSIFLGGINTKLDSFSACSHNYVELANASESDINLNGIYLLYRAPGVDEWDSIALRGSIKSGSTFLIQGDRCSYKSNVTLDSLSPDMIWNKNGKPIQFDNGGGCFYLVCSDGGKFYRDTDLVDLIGLSGYTPYSSTNTPVGYIDFVGIKTGNTTFTIPAEGSKPITVKSAENPNECIFVRSFPLDPCSQAQKTHDKKASSSLWTYINMSTKSSDGFPYYSDDDKQLFTPKGSVLNKNIFDVRTTFNPNKPNMLNVTFGIQATDAGQGATRCFNWISVGYYDEYIEYKKSSESWENAKKSYSIVKGNTYEDSNINTFIDIYSRIKWVTTNGTAVTTHKTIVRNLTSGTYDVRVRRDNSDYVGDVIKFTVRSNSEVTNFSFAHTSDQQAFNFYEYQAWTKSAYAINKKHPDIHFTINTGDMTQNGNRENEWLDYYNGRKSLVNIEDMPTIGNNDLCGIIPYELGNGNASKYKINHKNIQYYYCFELSETNKPIFTYQHSDKIDTNLLGDILSYTDNTFSYYMPSLYSFNYGKYHFICLNSEFALNTYSCYYNDPVIADLFKQHAYYNMYKWLEKDYDSSRNNIAYMHELPFCIVVGDSTTGIATPRTISNGSKLNNSFVDGVSKTPGSSDSAESFTGGCNFSEFFQTHNIKLCLGGHKHTYSLSYPTKENISGSGSQRVVSYNNPIVDTEGNDGVVYVMCQATGYKLVSNKELPGSGIAWLRKYFPMANKAASTSQYYPMYSIFNVNSNNVQMESYTVYNIYYENGTKATSFDINNQYQEFNTKNSVPIDGTNITIGY